MVGRRRLCAVFVATSNGHRADLAMAMAFAAADESEWRHMMQMAYAGQESGGADDFDGADNWTYAGDESEGLELMWGRMVDENDASSNRKGDIARPEVGACDLEWVAPVDPDEVALFRADDTGIRARSGRSRRRSLSDTSASDASTSSDSGSLTGSSSSSSPSCCPDSKRLRIPRLRSPPQTRVSDNAGLSSVHYVRHNSMAKDLEHLAIANPQSIGAVPALK